MRSASHGRQSTGTKGGPMEPMELFQAEFIKLRKTVQAELIAGLREDLRRTCFETVMAVVKDPELLEASRLSNAEYPGPRDAQYARPRFSTRPQSQPPSSFSRIAYASDDADTIHPPNVPLHEPEAPEGPAEDLGQDTEVQSNSSINHLVPQHLLKVEKQELPSCVGTIARPKKITATAIGPDGDPKTMVTAIGPDGEPEYKSEAEKSEEAKLDEDSDSEEDRFAPQLAEEQTFIQRMRKTVHKMFGHDAEDTNGQSMVGTLSMKPEHWMFTPIDDKFMVAKIVKSDHFDYAMSIVLILNSIVIGLRVDWEASNLGKKDIPVYIWVDRLFCVAFTSELCLRLFAFRLAFYVGPGWQWAYFDTVIVGFQIIEEIMLAAAGEAAINLGFLKMLKMGRLARMVRMVRLLPELKSLVLLIFASMNSFLWTCVLLMLLIYMLAIYMVMMAVERMEEDTAFDPLLQQYWGSVGSAVLSIYWSITGGQDWEVVIGPLQRETGTQLHNVVFCMFIAFATMVLMNLVTGVFVEGAARLTKEDRDKELSRMANKVFRMVDDDGSDEITKREFHKHLEAGNMDGYLRAVDLPRSAADHLFEILDTDKTGSIDVQEFVDGCLRMRGLPRSADVTQLLLETRKANTRNKEWFATISRLVMTCIASTKEMRKDDIKEMM